MKYYFSHHIFVNKDEFRYTDNILILISLVAIEYHRKFNFLEDTRLFSSTQYIYL